MKVLNIHERTVIGDADQARRVFDSIGEKQDLFWPRKNWPALRLNAPKEQGGSGGHGPIHYRSLVHESGKKTVFQFENIGLSRGLSGCHFFELQMDGDRVTARHVIDAKLHGWALLTWPLFIRPMHDALLEEALDNFEKAITGFIKKTSAYSPYVRLLRFLIRKDRTRRVLR